MRNLNEALVNSKLDENQDDRGDVSEEDLPKNSNELCTDNTNSKIKINFLRNSKEYPASFSSSLPKSNFDYESSSTKKNNCSNEISDTFKLIVENYDDESYSTNNSNYQKEEKNLTKSNSFETKYNDNGQNDIKKSNTLINITQIQDILFKKVYFLFIYRFVLSNKNIGSYFKARIFYF